VVWLCAALASNKNEIETLTFSMVVVSAVIFFVQLSIWTRINDRLAPEQQIGWRQALLEYFIWFQEGGLLAQYARLYPQSSLGTVFRVLWGIFWLLAATRVIAK
jgi:hypothetical protein